MAKDLKSPIKDLECLKKPREIQISNCVETLVKFEAKNI